MESIYSQILAAKALNKKLLAILIDPDKVSMEEIANLFFENSKKDPNSIQTT